MKNLGREIRGADSVKERNEIHEVENKRSRRGTKDYGGEIKGMKAREENKRFRRKIKGAESAEGANEKHEGGNKM